VSRQQAVWPTAVVADNVLPVPQTVGTIVRNHVSTVTWRPCFEGLNSLRVHHVVSRRQHCRRKVPHVQRAILVTVVSVPALCYCECEVLASLRHMHLGSFFLEPEGINPLNGELNPICHFLALLGAHHILHISSVRVKSINLGAIWSFSKATGLP
jgi:hypothetical protein